MRIMIIISSFAIEGPQGGVERFAIELASHLDLSRIDLTICGLWYHGFDYEHKWMCCLEQRGVTVVTTTAWTGSTSKDAGSALKFLKKYTASRPKFDIINSHAAFPDIAAVWLGLLGRADNLIRTVHSEREWYRRPTVGLFFNHLITPFMFQTELGVSKKIVADLNARPLSALLRRQAQVCYNAIDHQRIIGVKVDLAAKKQSLGLSPGVLVIGNVARFTKQKGHIYFLAMAKLVLEQYPDCQFLLIGIGELMQEMKEKAAEFGISDKIHFLGSRTDVEELLPVMDIFVSSSLWEGLPTVILEAMAAGVPVVATDVSGSAELVQNGKTGFLVSPADALSLTEAVCTLLHEPSLGKEFVKNARQFAQKFDISKIALEYEELFNKICKMGL